jgi:putative flippase GtrA
VFRTRPTARSFLAYQAASAVSLAVQLVATPALTLLGMYYLVAYPVAVVLGWVVKYAIVRRAVFR